MRSPETLLYNLSKHSSNKEYKFDRIYRNLFNKELFFVAYQKIASNSGAMTAGADGVSVDGMSLERIEKIIQSLKDESYKPQPSRRVYIPKKNGDKRPLGIPSFNDKLVQEVVRMILDAIYDDSFSEASHGFRKGRSCHTALHKIQMTYTGVKWFIEGDIKGFFDNISHDMLISIMRKRISDERFLRLIRKFLNAGYFEQSWDFRNTYSGTPQGGIISPILANIYLNELDEYILEYKTQFDTGKERKRNPEYRVLEVRRGKLVKSLNNTKSVEEREEIIESIRNIEKERKDIPYGDPMDAAFKRMQYVRYADDFLVGVIGSKEDCRKIKEDLTKFLKEKLALEMSQEKTLITNAQKPANFLGYEISVRNTMLQKRDSQGRLMRNYTGRVKLSIPKDTIKNKLLSYGVMTISTVDGKELWKPKARYRLKDNDDLEIIEKYNSEIRGFYNYYCLAHNSSSINKFAYIMEYSMYKTYATKYRTTKGNIIDSHRIGKDFGIKYTNKKGAEKVCLFYNKGFKHNPNPNTNSNCDIEPDMLTQLARTSLVDRLQACKCELCGAEGVPLEMHHVNKLKNLKGKTYWEQLLIARKRKTIAVCNDCHNRIHAGTA